MCAFLRDGGDKTNSGIRCRREICLYLCDKLWGGADRFVRGNS